MANTSAATSSSNPPPHSSSGTSSTPMSATTQSAFSAVSSTSSEPPPDTLTAAIYGLQRQLGNMVARLSSMEDRLPLPPPSGPPPTQPLYDISGYGGLPSAPLSLHHHPHPTIHPPAPNPLNSLSPLAITNSLPCILAKPPPNHDDDKEGAAIPRYYKLSFPMYDGKDDPLGWLNRCEHFFRAQRTREADKV